jgi:hypothetical protein
MTPPRRKMPFKTPLNMNSTVQNENNMKNTVRKTSIFL